MDVLQTVAISWGLAWASGLRLYLVLFVVGLAGRFGYISPPPGLELLSHDWVLVASGLMCAVEFVADKVPVIDSLWDSVHTFIRIPAGAILAAAAMGVEHPALTLSAAIVGGTITSGAHAVKAGSRVLINASPEPVSNWSASFGEDGLALGALWLAFAHPVLCLIALGLFLLLLIWLVPKLWRAVRTAIRGRVFNRARSVV